MNEPHTIAVEFKQVSKSFGTQRVLNDVFGDVIFKYPICD